MGIYIIFSLLKKKKFSKIEILKLNYYIGKKKKKKKLDKI